MSTIASAYVQILPSTKGIKSQLTSEFNTIGDSAGKGMSGNLLASLVGGLTGGAMVAIGKDIAGSLIRGISSAIGEAGDLQQSLGGIETLFKENAERVVQNASQAWKTAGLSANQYMENVTGFSASLLQSLGGDTKKAAEIANMAIIDMSDNANKMGTDIGMIQNAYQGFARQQYQMLDNLKLGYGGTRGEMERLLADASKLSGIRYDISNLSDVYSAIHVIQKELGITGTTAEEAASTLQGSFAAVKASIENLLGGMGGGVDMSQLFDNLTEAWDTFFTDNLTPMIINFFKSIPSLIEGFLKDGFQKSIKNIGSDITKIITAIVTGLVEGLVKLEGVGVLLIGQLLAGIAEALPDLISGIGDMFENLAEYFPQLAVVFVEQLPQIIGAIITGLIKCIPALINALGDIVAALIQAIPPLLSGLADAFSSVGGMIVSSLAPVGDQILSAIQPAIDQIAPLFAPIADVIRSTFDTLLPSIQNLFNSIGQFASACANLIGTIFAPVGNAIGAIFEVAADKIRSAFSGIGSFMRQMGQQMVTAFKQVIAQFADIGRQIIENLKNGMMEMWNNLISTVKNWIDQIASLFNGLTNTVNNATNRINGSMSSTQTRASALSTSVGTSMRSLSTSSTLSYEMNSENSSMTANSAPTPVNVNVTLSGSAKSVFDSVRVENMIQQNATGYSALA